MSLNKLQKIKRKLYIRIDRYNYCVTRDNDILIVDSQDKNKPVLVLNYISDKPWRVICNDCENIVKRYNEDYCLYNDQLLQYFMGL